MIKQVKQVPRWLKRLGRVKEELRSVRFPRTAEEGFRQCVALSALGRRLLRDGVRDGRPRADEQKVAIATRRLLARISYAEARHAPRWRKDCARFFGR